MFWCLTIVTVTKNTLFIDHIFAFLLLCFQTYYMCNKIRELYLHFVIRTKKCFLNIRKRVLILDEIRCLCKCKSSFGSIHKEIKQLGNLKRINESTKINAHGNTVKSKELSYWFNRKFVKSIDLLHPTSESITIIFQVNPQISFRRHEHHTLGFVLFIFLTLG